ncbi:Gfo/Idh/MocA family protein [Pseudozobellia thermophila]|uniref:Predicted dehydrogenase n=1 Tax=Pseudozobellia thermophila TaxID=192903 RepID=A0A1M6CGB9_9FLAO|nr:Gfo/Idh/MocA family oxidoreductase [Pseudozobellia thermophila]SHI60062.1 Predicted dehydrogenase [Pseudozobellia thermophila]
MKKAGKGAVFSMVAGAVPGVALSKNSGKKNVKEFKIGIIGAENSHTAGFGKLFNIDNTFPGMKVTHVWGETEAFAKKAMKEGRIPNRVDDPEKMLGKIDALIVDHRHGKYHLDAALPFIKAGIPTFIDKPFCYRASAGKDFLALAKKYGTPVTSFSSIAHSHETFALKEQLKNMGPINQVVRYGPVDLDSKYGGVFFYGPHTVQPLLYLFDGPVEKVQVHRNGQNSSASLVFKNGMLATLIFTTKKYGWHTYVETEAGIVELKTEIDGDRPGKNYEDMVQMFKTGQEPRSHKNIIECVAVLEALEKSADNGPWESVTPYDDI